MSIVVTLAPHEIEFAASVGLRRQVAAFAKGLADRHGFEGDGWNVHIAGALGEMAAARAIDRYWNASVNTFRGQADIGDNLEVRTRSKPEYELLLRRDDDPNHYYLHVTGRCPTFTVHGYVLGERGMRLEFLQTHGGRPPAFFVPYQYLQSLPM